MSANVNANLVLCCNELISINNKAKLFPLANIYLNIFIVVSMGDELVVEMRGKILLKWFMEYLL